MHACKCIKTKESVYTKIELNSHRVGLVQQHGKRKYLHRKRVELPQGWCGTTTWPKESIYIRKELNSHRIGLVQQNGKRKYLHKKRVELPQDWFDTTTWQKKVFT